ncbi:hypothetical protein ACQ4PT_068909 [Festuca glaucescens]
MDQCLQVALVAGTDAIATQSNFIFSPLSLRAALAVLAAGTKGETLRELLTFLGSQELHLLNATSAGLIAEMRSWPQLSFAAGIFADRSLSLRPDFVSTASSAHGAFGRSLDFQNQPEAAAAEVNAFIAKTTRGCLRDLVSAGTFKGDTKIVLANAMHFKATWAARRFDPSDTVRSQFNRLDGTSLRVPFLSDPGMQYADSFEDLGFKVLQCFYKMVGRDGKLDPKAPFFSMLIFLPHRRDGLSDLLRGCDLPSPSQTLSCAALPVWQKCAVKVDEEGTTAVGATYMCASTTYDLPSTPPPPPMSFVADHPFMFAIVEYGKGQVLFLGHVMDTSKET